ncbi:VQ [Macleaya cordata]|uniref:VQ n=1 Tax=Macleaya cordata TaxID=56857 RepID=A0A200Q4B2_MACCD|nr:VQ [Macleaya cordata]
MDKLKIQHQSRKCKRTSKVNRKPMKITYISDPMMFKASSAEFKALVQQLTGQDSYASNSEVTTEMTTSHEIVDDEFSNAISSNEFNYSRGLSSIQFNYSGGLMLEQTVVGFDPYASLYDDIFFQEA